MKKIILTLIFILQINIASAMTYANEPSNFFGLNWGSSIKQLEQNNQFTLLEKTTHLTLYTSKTLPKTIYNFDFDTVIYTFFNDQLFLITATKQTDTQKSLYKTLVENHSIASATRQNLNTKTTTTLWQGLQTTIELNQNAKTKTTELKLYNHKLNLHYQLQKK